MWWLITALAAARPAPVEPEKAPTSPGVEQHVAPFRTLQYTVDEGTWMNLDVSPDGRTVVFDLLGQIYTLPIGGGAAAALTSGNSWNMQPRFSPDGRRIAFTSDRGGGDNLWVMNADGTGPQAVTDERFRLVTQPEWTPDGRWIFGRKHFTGTRSLGTGEVWAFDPSGVGEGVAWTEKGHLEADVNEPTLDPDGEWLYVSEAGPFQYNRDIYDGIYAIVAWNLFTGERRDIAGGPGGAVRPQISPDGRLLGYLRRSLDGQRDAWVVRDLSSGRERIAFSGLDRDQQETWSVHGTYPAWSWLPDGGGAVFYQGGHLVRVGLDGEARPIPFTATVVREVEDAVRQPHLAAPTEVQARVIRWPRRAGDGRLLFQALGRVWIQAPGAAPVAVSPEGQRAFAPAWRSDGRAITWVSWSDRDGGMVWLAPVEGVRVTDDPLAIGDGPDFYTSPAFSQDGARIIWVRGSGLSNRGHSAAEEGQLRLQWREPGGPVHDAGRVSNAGAGVRPPRPRFAPDGRHIWVTDTEGEETVLVELTVDGLDRRILARGEYAAEIEPSPDGRFIAWKAQHQAWVGLWPPRGVHPVVLGTAVGSVPAVRLSADLGEWLAWSTADKLTWAAGPEVFTVDLSAGLPREPAIQEIKASKKDLWPVHLRPALGERTAVDLRVTRGVTDQAVALVGATVIPMVGDTIFDHGVVVVRGERIVAVGRVGEVEVPADARIIDTTGQFVLPGLIDVHAHMGYGFADVSPEIVPAYAANLAYGVTTTHDPSAETQYVFSQHELVELGEVVGPRILSTGYILYGAEDDDKAVVESLDDARSHLRRMALYGAFSVKSYNQPRRDQRRWILQAARELGMLVVPEGGSTLAHNLTMIIDGHTGIEHAVPVEQLHSDVIQLWAGNAGVHYTPTLLVGYGGLWGENSFYQRFDVWARPRLQHWTPPGLLESRGKRRPVMAPEEDWHHVRLAQTAQRLQAAGVKVNLGGHGQLQGLGPHWEMWAMVDGGFTAMQALRAGTINGAEYLGIDQDLGSLQPGRLADLMVLTADPLKQIHNTESVWRVMKGGVLYESDTLATVWPEAGPPLATPWHDAGGSPGLLWTDGRCGCAD